VEFWTLIASAVAAFGAVVAVWYARRAEKRSADRGDVFWRIFREAADAFRIWNAGQDTAFEVRLVLTVAEHSYEGTAADVPKGDGLIVVAPIAGTLHARWIERRQRVAKVAPAMKFPVEPMELRLHITWRSKNGRWTTQDYAETMSSALL
jgi:hypothetical protein